MDLGSSKESHHIIIEEEYEPSNSLGSLKEEAGEETSKGSNKEKLSSQESRRIIEVEFEPSTSSNNVIPEESEGSSKEKLRPISDQIRLKNYSEYTDGSAKERYISELIEESDGQSEITVGSEKEQQIEKSSHGSNKDHPPKSYLEVSSLGSGKEEINESR